MTQATCPDCKEQYALTIVNSRCGDCTKRRYSGKSGSKSAKQRRDSIARQREEHRREQPCGITLVLNQEPSQDQGLCPEGHQCFLIEEDGQPFRSCQGPHYSQYTYAPRPLLPALMDYVVRGNADDDTLDYLLTKLPVITREDTRS
jgi:hypothetical protein